VSDPEKEPSLAWAMGAVLVLVVSLGFALAKSVNRAEAIEREKAPEPMPPPIIVDAGKPPERPCCAFKRAAFADCEASGGTAVMGFDTDVVCISGNVSTVTTDQATGRRIHRGDNVRPYWLNSLDPEPDAKVLP